MSDKCTSESSFAAALRHISEQNHREECALLVYGGYCNCHVSIALRALESDPDVTEDDGGYSLAAHAIVKGADAKAELEKVTTERDEWEEMFGEVAHAVVSAAGLDDSNGWDDGLKKLQAENEKLFEVLAAIVTMAKHDPACACGHCKARKILAHIDPNFTKHQEASDAD